jgi:hypothetical protein
MMLALKPSIWNPSDTHGINKKGRETHVSLLARAIYHLIRESVDLEDDVFLQTVHVWNNSS